MSPITATPSSSYTSNNSTTSLVPSTQPSLLSPLLSEHVYFKVLVASLVVGCFGIAILASLAIFYLIRRRLKTKPKQLLCAKPGLTPKASSPTAGARWSDAIQGWIGRHLQRRRRSAAPIYICKTLSDLRTTDQLISSRDWLVQPLVPLQAPPATLSTTTVGCTSSRIITSISKAPPPGIAVFCYSPSIYSRRSSRSSSFTLFQEDYPPTSASLVSPI